MLRFHLLDNRERNCMHYAAIKGDSKLINCLYMLYRQNGMKKVGNAAELEKARKEASAAKNLLEVGSASAQSAFEGGSEESGENYSDDDDDEKIDEDMENESVPADDDDGDDDSLQMSRSKNFIPELPKGK